MYAKHHSKSVVALTDSCCSTPRPSDVPSPTSAPLPQPQRSPVIRHGTHSDHVRYHSSPSVGRGICPARSRARRSPSLSKRSGVIAQSSRDHPPWASSLRLLQPCEERCPTRVGRWCLVGQPRRMANRRFRLPGLWTSRRELVRDSRSRRRAVHVSLNRMMVEARLISARTTARSRSSLLQKTTCRLCSRLLHTARPCELLSPWTL